MNWYEFFYASANALYEMASLHKEPDSVRHRKFKAWPKKLNSVSHHCQQFYKITLFFIVRMKHFGVHTVCCVCSSPYSVLVRFFSTADSVFDEWSFSFFTTVLYVNLLPTACLLFCCLFLLWPWAEAYSSGLRHALCASGVSGSGRGGGGGGGGT